MSDEMVRRLLKAGHFRRRARTVMTHFRRHGSKAGLRMLLGETLDRTGLVRIAVLYTLPDSIGALEASAQVSGLHIRRLDASEVRLRASRMEDWFFKGAVDESLARGDLCLGGYLDDSLVCSNWFTVRPIRVLGRMLQLPKGTVFEYRCFTKPQYRGRGLAAALKLPAARIYAGRGFTSFLNTVMWTNDASRRLNERMGYRRAGAIVKLGPFNRLTYLVGSTPEGTKLAP